MVPDDACPGEGSLSLEVQIPHHSVKLLEGVVAFWKKATVALERALASLLNTALGQLLVSAPADSPLAPLTAFFMGRLSSDDLP